MDFDRDIHYSRKAEKVKGRSGGIGPLIATTAAMAAGVAAYLFARFVARVLGLSQGAAIGVIAGIVGPVIIAAIWLVVWTPRPTPDQKCRMKDLAPVSDERFRLRVAGAPHDAALLLDIADEAFEPMVFFGGFAVTPPMPARCVGVAIAVGIMALYRIGLHHQLDTFTAMACVFVGASVMAFMWQTYIRITPGRMDVMRYTLWNSKPEIVSTHDLRTARVVVDMRRWALFIAEPGRGETTYSYAAIWGRWKFARAVLTGAVSTAPSVALPEGELVG